MHVAAHGLIRADNALFSSLKLADGPLTVYDWERLDSDLDSVVLAECESGRGAVLADDEMLGLSAAFLSAGRAMWWPRGGSYESICRPVLMQRDEPRMSSVAG